MRSKSFWVGVAVLAAGLTFVTGGGAATMTTVTLTVNSTADPVSPVGCTVANNKSTGTCTLRSAIIAARSYGHDNTMFVIKLAAKTYKLTQGTLDVGAATSNTGNIIQIVGKTKTTGKGKHKRTMPASIIDGSGNAAPSSVFLIESPTQMSNVVITGGTGNPYFSCFNGSNAAGCGGGLFVDSSLDLQNSVVQKNTACSAYTGHTCTGTYVYGGGIYVPDDGVNQVVTLYKTTVTHNVASGGGGIANRGYPSTLLIMSSHIDKNTACDTFSNGVCVGYGFGGGLANGGEQVTLDHSTVDGNVAGSPAYSQGEGGGIFQVNDNVQLNHTTVSGNVAGYDGGGIAVNDDNIDLVDSTVSHNVAGVEGGGMYLDWLASYTKTTFSSNTAGGAFECTISGNKTTCKGTVKATTGTCATLYASASQCTSSDGYGGGLYSSREYPQFISSTVTKNLAASIKGDASGCGGGLGGGVFTNWTLTAVAGTKFTKNTADCGGGIYDDQNNTGPSTFALSSSTIASNTALEDGGGIWTTGSGTGTLYGMTITKNKAGRQTGGVWDDQLGSVLLGAGNKITKNTGHGACKNITWPCK